MVEDELKRSVGVGSCGGVRGKIKNGQRRRGKKKKEKNEIRRFGMVTARPGMFFFLGPGGGPCGSRAHVGSNHSFAHFVIVPARHSHVEGSFVMANMGSL